MAHITGGGFIENIPRMLPEGFGAEIELGSLGSISRFLIYLKKVGKLEREEMYQYF